MPKDWHHGGSSIGHLGYLMFDMRSVFHRAKTFSTVVTKQVSYQIFICIFYLRVTSPRMGIRLWATEASLCLPCHINSNTSSTRLLNKTNNCYLFSLFQTPCHGLKKLSIGENSQCCKYEEFTNRCLFNYFLWFYKFLWSVSSTSKTLINKQLNATFPLC